MVEAVVFDIGNVLIEGNPSGITTASCPRAERRARAFAEVDLHGMNDVIDRGGNWRETVHEWAARWPPVGGRDPTLAR
ncbi:MAG: hypothetical protein R3D78_06020 [Paracoccaceae bacterium]